MTVYQRETRGCCYHIHSYHWECCVEYAYWTIGFPLSRTQYYSDGQISHGSHFEQMKGQLFAVDVLIFSHAASAVERQQQMVYGATVIKVL